jgi:hypothetical protein
VRFEDVEPAKFADQGKPKGRKHKDADHEDRVNARRARGEDNDEQDEVAAELLGTDTEDAEDEKKRSKARSAKAVAKGKTQKPGKARKNEACNGLDDGQTKKARKPCNEEEMVQVGAEVDDVGIEDGKPEDPEEKTGKCKQTKTPRAKAKGKTKKSLKARRTDELDDAEDEKAKKPPAPGNAGRDDVVDVGLELLSDEDGKPEEQQTDKGEKKPKTPRAKAKGKTKKPGKAREHEEASEADPEKQAKKPRKPRKTEEEYVRDEEAEAEAERFQALLPLTVDEIKAQGFTEIATPAWVSLSNVYSNAYRATTRRKRHVKFARLYARISTSLWTRHGVCFSPLRLPFTAPRARKSKPSEADAAEHAEDPED